MDFAERFTCELQKLEIYESLPLQDGKFGPLPFTRLLYLQPGSSGDELLVDLAAANVREVEGHYEALSYVWGPSNPPAYVLCGANRVKVKVTQNLYQALLHLRHTDHVRVLWADAVCINQEDLHERSQQVQLMRYIYKHASRTYIWFGADRLLELDLLLVKNSYRKMCSRAVAQEPSLRQQEIFLGLYSGLVKSVSRLLDNAWYSRMWVVQEATVSSHTIAMCGFVTFDFLQLLKLIPALEPPDDVLSTQSSLEIWSRLHELRSTPKRVESSLGSLLSVLQNLRGFQATDPRDKLYAILGITNEGLSPSLSQMDETHAYTNVSQSANPIISFIQDLTDEMAILPEMPFIKEARNHLLPSNLDDLPPQQISTFSKQIEFAAREQGLIGIADLLRESARQSGIGLTLPQPELDSFVSYLLWTDIARTTRFNRTVGLSAVDLEQELSNDLAGRRTEEDLDWFEQMLREVQERDPTQVDRIFQSLGPRDTPQPLIDLTAQLERTLSHFENSTDASAQPQIPLVMARELLGIIKDSLSCPGSNADDPFGLRFIRNLTQFLDRQLLDRQLQITPGLRPWINVENSIDEDFDRLTSPAHFHVALIPDYTKTAEQVYTDLTLYFIHRQPGVLDVLSHVQHHSIPVLGAANSWPSWVPRWDEPAIGKLFAMLGDFAAGTYDKICARSSPAYDKTKTITLKGHMLAEIMHTSSSISAAMHIDLATGTKLIIIEFKFRNVPGHYFTANTAQSILRGMYDAFQVKSLRAAQATANNASDHRTVASPEAFARASEQHFPEWRPQIECAMTTTSNTFEHDVKVPFDNAWCTVAQTLHKRRFFQAIGNSETELWGVGPHVIRPSDKLVILQGGKVPYVLREVEELMTRAQADSSARYRFLGEAFVDEEKVMSGEALAGGKLGRERDFVLF